MSGNDGYVKILRDETFRETVSHGGSEYPFRYYYEDIWEFELHCIDWHWHPEVEFVYIEKGVAQCFVGNGRYELRQGEAIFINTQVIHRFEAKENTVIPNVVFSPVLLAGEDSLLYRKYILPILESSVECVVFSPERDGQKNILNTLLSVLTLQDTEAGSEIKTVALLLQLWDQMNGAMPLNMRGSAPNASKRTKAQLQIMLEYIHENYAKKVLLDHIAKTVSLSKSSVLSIFKEYLHTSPVQYLIEYRLRKAAKLLTDTEDNISAIALATGFENVGYFCRKFRELFHCTPGAYRKGGFRKILHE